MTCRLCGFPMHCDACGGSGVIKVKRNPMVYGVFTCNFCDGMHSLCRQDWKEFVKEFRRSGYMRDPYD